MTTKDVEFIEQLIDKKITKELSSLPQSEKITYYIKHFVERYMPTINGDQMLPQSIFRLFLQEISSGLKEYLYLNFDMSTGLITCKGYENDVFDSLETGVWLGEMTTTQLENNVKPVIFAIYKDGSNIKQTIYDLEDSCLSGFYRYLIGNAFSRWMTFSSETIQNIYSEIHTLTERLTTIEQTVANLSESTIPFINIDGTDVLDESLKDYTDVGLYIVRHRVLLRTGVHFDYYILKNSYALNTNTRVGTCTQTLWNKEGYKIRIHSSKTNEWTDWTEYLYAYQEPETEINDYQKVEIQLANGNYMYPDNRYAMGSTERRTLGYIKAGIENGIEVFYITDPDDGGYLYRDTTDYGQNGDWTCNQLKFMPLNENDDRFKWYVAYKDGQQNQPRIINLAGSSKNKNNIANTDYGIHIYNWSQSWMDVAKPNVVCGKGVNNGNTELNAEIKFLEE